MRGTTPPESVVRMALAHAVCHGVIPGEVCTTNDERVLLLALINKGSMLAQ